MWLSFILSIFDLDGLEDAFEGTVAALELVLFVLAVLIGVGTVQVVVDRRSRRVKVLNQGTTAAPDRSHGHPGAVDDVTRANKARVHG